MKYITVFCSAKDVNEKYKKAVEDFGRLIAKSGFGLVWGGTDTGIMKVVADSVKNEGGRIIGVSIPYFNHLAKKNADEMYVVETLDQRKKKMLELGSAVVTLIGGIGTLDEVSEIIELKRQEEHNKPIVFLNTENFYNDLRNQLNKMNIEGFMHKELNDLVVFLDHPQEVVDYLIKSI